ncbi:MAG: hypothetical protein ABFC62_09235 [Clostridiaceae bacterium]|nr:hypothetical protein [Eubacteriales bacterium]
MEGIAFVPDNNRIWLTSLRDVASRKDGFFYFEISVDDPDDAAQNDEFNKVMFDLISTFSKNRVVRYEASYKQIKSARKKWFGRGWRTGKYSQKGCASKLKQHLIDTGWKDGLFADIVDFYEKKIWWSIERFYFKQLCIVQDRLDFALFRETDMTWKDDSAYGTDIAVFAEPEVRHCATDYETVYTYYKSDNYMLTIFADIMLPRGSIVINNDDITTEEFIAKLKPIVERHNKTLEVNL